MLIDSHCHLNFNAFDQDRAQVIGRAKEAGVVAFINPGTNLDDSQQVVALTEEFPEVYAAVGVHPNDAAAFDETDLAQLRELAGHPNVVAIGEIGLDYYHMHADKDVQQNAFKKQIIFQSWKWSKDTWISNLAYQRIIWLLLILF